jgi:hypothetical protein
MDISFGDIFVILCLLLLVILMVIGLVVDYIKVRMDNGRKELEGSVERYNL